MWVGMPVVSIVIGIIVFMRMKMRRGTMIDRQRQLELYTELDREHEANFAQRKPIDEGLFVKADVSRLPFNEYEEDLGIRGVSRRCIEAAHRTMIMLPEGISNREVKQLYGAAHFYDIIQYEENYHEFLQAGNVWAELLLDAGRCDEAKVVLNVLIEAKAYTSQTYSLLERISDKETKGECQ